MHEPDKTIKLRDGRTCGFDQFGHLSGKPLLYLHGAQSSRLEAAAFDEAAERAGLMLVSPDRPGCGLSDPLPGRSVLSYTTDLAELADSLSIGKFAAAGFSNGGMFALGAASQMPERIPLVALINCTTPVYDRSARAALPASARLAYAAVRTAPSLIGRTSRRRNQAGLQGVAGEGVDLETVKKAASNAVRQPQSKYLEEEMSLAVADWGFDHRSVIVRVEIFTGEADAGAAYARIWAGELPQGTLHTFEGGHLGAFVPHTAGSIMEVISGRLSL